MRRAVPTLTAALCLLAAGCPNSLARLAYDELRRPRATLDELSAEPAAASAPSAASEEPDAAAAQLVTGERIVVAAEHRDASRAGIEVAKGGGNVVDVAVATAFAVCVANPSSCGIGGGGFLVLYLARERRAVALDYREVAPQAAHRDMFVRGGKVDPNLSRRGGLAVGVPGEVAGLLAAHRAYGKLPLAKVMAPAIRFARDGVAIGAHLAETIAANVAAIRKSPPMATILLHADGRPRAAGERLQQPQLAATLSRIARDREAAFYRGGIARQIVAAVTDAGGVISEADLASYRPVWREPVQMAFHGDTVVAMPPPSSAGVLLQVLGMIEGDDLPALGRTSAGYRHLLAEAMKHGFADRARLYGDPLFGSLPVPQLIAPANLAALRARIQPDRVLANQDYGSGAVATADLGDDHGTSHVSVLDREGNAVACTTTINTAFGALVMAGDTGVFLNNQMDDFSAQPGVPNIYGLVGGEANAIAPGRRPLSSMSPTVVVRDGKAVLAAGGSGGPLILSATLQSLLNTRVFALDAAQAISAPRLHHQWLPPVLGVEPQVAARSRAELSRRGHQVREMSFAGAVQLAQRRGGKLEGASDARKGGEAAAW